MPAEPSHPYTVLDVFTSTPLQGNALAVFTEGEAVPSRLMAAVTRELHLSETAFLLPGEAGDDADPVDATVRIFTPEVELPFAGHPVLGAAFVVGERDNLAAVRLRTGAGIIPVLLTREHGEIVYGEMEQPLPSVSAYEHADRLLQALGVERAELPVERYVNGPEHVLVALRAAAEVQALSPNQGELTKLGGHLTISCFAMTGDGAVRTRVFCPGMGVPEDPATGSAAGPLALHLGRHGWASPGQTLAIVQGVEINRPSELSARFEGTPDHPTRIVVGGSAVTVAHGHLRLQ
jgi:trans-2,3-dihydro-3-hydroxyanthranilate isomerase